MGLVQIGPIKADDVFGVAFVQDLQLSENLLAHGGFGINKDNLKGRASSESWTSTQAVIMHHQVLTFLAMIVPLFS